MREVAEQVAIVVPDTTVHHHDESEDENGALPNACHRIQLAATGTHSLPLSHERCEYAHIHSR